MSFTGSAFRLVLCGDCLLGAALYDKCPMGAIPKPGNDAIVSKKQMVLEAGDEGLTAAELFYSLAA
jgi:hypothetical protein